MSVSKWAYDPKYCDGGGCPGDCDLCDKPKNMEDEDDINKDVVAVVRCKDCKHYKDNHRCYSKYSNMNDYRSPNDYCSYGERAEE